MFAFYHKLNWLPLPCFIQLCAMYHQYHKFKYILLKRPIIFSGTSYYTRTPLYFANISMSRLNFTRFFILMPHNGGIHYHLLWLSISHPFYVYVDALKLILWLTALIFYYDCICSYVLCITMLSLFCVVTILSLSFCVTLLVVVCVCNIVCVCM